MELPADFRDQVLDKLKERGVRFECELCGQNDWSIFDRPLPVQVASGSVSPPYIPSAALICSNCGNMRLLALGALDLSPDRDLARKKEPA
jgi:hypothetical protein